MIQIMRRTLLISAAAYFLAAPLDAQVAEVSVSGGRSSFSNSGLGSSGADTYKVDNGIRIGFRFTLNTRRFMGHEFGYSYNRSKLGLLNRPDNVGMPVHQGFYNYLLYALPEGAAIRPFAAGGGHFSTFYPPGTSVYSGTGFTRFGVNYGGGIKVKLTPLFALRLDIRDYVTMKPDFGLANRTGLLHHLETSAGFGVYF